MTRRIRIHLGVGDILQLAGVAGACIAVGHLAGLWWGVLAGALFVVVEANLTYGGRAVTLALPNRQDLLRARHRAGAPWRALAGAGKLAAAAVAARVRK